MDELSEKMLKMSAGKDQLHAMALAANDFFYRPAAGLRIRRGVDGLLSGRLEYSLGDGEGNSERTS